MKRVRLKFTTNVTLQGFDIEAGAFANCRLNVGNTLVRKNMAVAVDDDGNPTFKKPKRRMSPKPDSPPADETDVMAGLSDPPPADDPPPVGMTNATFRGGAKKKRAKK